LDFTPDGLAVKEELGGLRRISRVKILLLQSMKMMMMIRTESDIFVSVSMENKSFSELSRHPFHSFLHRSEGENTLCYIWRRSILSEYVSARDSVSFSSHHMIGHLIHWRRVTKTSINVFPEGRNVLFFSWKT